MTDTTDVAIEVKQYVDEAGTQQTIVPRVVGQTQQARQTKSAAGRAAAIAWDEEPILEQSDTVTRYHRAPVPPPTAARLSPGLLPELADQLVERRRTPWPHAAGSIGGHV